MKIDASKSKYQEREHERGEFTQPELRKARVVLRRLRFLEEMVRRNGGLRATDATGGAAFTEMEIEALEWILDEINFLAPREDSA